jgi:hypothetical protein
MSRDITWRPRQDSNLRPRLRRPVLYPLSYGGPRLRAKDYQPISCPPAVEMIDRNRPTVSGVAVRSRP